MGPHQVYAMVVSLVFCGTPNSGSRSASDSFVCSWDSSSCWVALASISVRAVALSLLYFALSCLVVLGDLFFFKERQRGVNLEERRDRNRGIVRGWGDRELGVGTGRVGGETEVRRYCLRTKAIIN